MIKVHTCPNCNSTNVAELCYGFVAVDDALAKDIDAGRAKLAGCERQASYPNFYCNDCKYQWKHGGRKAKQLDFENNWLKKILSE